MYLLTKLYTWHESIKNYESIIDFHVIAVSEALPIDVFVFWRIVFETMSFPETEGLIIVRSHFYRSVRQRGRPLTINSIATTCLVLILFA